MKEITIEERKTISLEILSEIHDFCEKNNICYFLDYGTLLGAVRHKGYIPWDDDIDISMKRDDYERFLKTFCSSKYEIANYRDKKFFAIQFSKVYDKKTFGILLDKINLNYGVAVDVFPLDEIPEQDNEQKVILRKIKHVDRFYLKSLFCQNFVRIESIKDIVKLIYGKIFPATKLAKKRENVVLDNQSKETTLLGFIDSTIRLDINKKSSYDSRILLDFEGNQFYAPKDYESVLISHYGENYMQPPAEKDRESTHTEKYYWKEDL